MALLALIDSYRPLQFRDNMPRVHWQGLAPLADYHSAICCCVIQENNSAISRKGREISISDCVRALQHGRTNTPGVQAGSFEQNLRRVFEAPQAERHYKPAVYPGKVTLFWSSATPPGSISIADCTGVSGGEGIRGRYMQIWGSSMSMIVVHPSARQIAGCYSKFLKLMRGILGSKPFNFPVLRKDPAGLGF